MTETLHTPRPSELVEHFLAEAISNSPQPLKDLALFLSSALSEDDWKTADRLLLALALRNRTSEPEAGAVAWFRQSKQNPKAWYQIDDEERAHYERHGSRILPLYDPAPATADKLREIAKGLNVAMSWVDYPFVENNTPVDEIRQRLGFMQKDAEPHRQALAALNEQPQ